LKEKRYRSRLRRVAIELSHEAHAELGRRDCRLQGPQLRDNGFDKVTGDDPYAAMSAPANFRSPARGFQALKKGNRLGFSL
jgi:hypothetical protein